MRGALDVSLVAIAAVIDVSLWGFDGATRWGWSMPSVVVLATAGPVFWLAWQRGRYPRGSYAAAWAYSVIWGGLLCYYQPFTALLLALHQIARRQPLRTALPYLLASFGPWAINTASAAALVSASVVTVAGIAAVWVALTGLVWIAGRLGRQSAAHAELRASAIAAESALRLQAERLSLARELHDSVANSMTAVLLAAANGRATSGAAIGNRAVGNRDGAAVETPETTLAAIEGMSASALREMRRLMAVLRSGQSPHAGADRVGLSGIAQAMADARALGVQVSLASEGFPGQLDATVELVAQRVVTEGLVNAAKHAGPGARATVSMVWQPHRLALEVADTRPSGLREPIAPGTGSGRSEVLSDSPLSGGLGLVGLSELVGDVGGTLRATQRDDGFTLHAELPVASGGTIRHTPAV